MAGNPRMLPLRVDVLTAQRVVVGTSWDHRGFNDPYTRLYCVHGGTGYVTMRGKRHRLTGGSLLAIPAHTTCDLFCPKTMDVSYVHCTAVLEGGAEFFGALGADLEAAEAGVAAQPLFARLCAVWKEGTPWALMEADGLVRLVLALFCRATDPEHMSSRTRAAERFAPVVEYVTSHLGGRLTTAILARTVNLHPTYFANLFSRQFGVGPRGYVLRRRVEAARVMLKSSGGKLEAVARELGFAGASHLSKEFRRLTGVSPREYRRMPTGVA